MRPFFIALQFLTRLPVKPKGEWLDKHIAQSVLYYPLVGALIGTMLWCAGELLSASSPMLAAVVLLVLWVLITGGLHLDGLADSADAWAGGYGDKQRSLDIMKDPAAGPLAVVVLILLLLTKLVALMTLLETQQLWGLFIAPILGRLSVIALFVSTPYVRKQGLGSAMSEHLNRDYAYGVIFCVMVLLVLFFPVKILLLTMVASVLVLAFLRQLMKQRLQGMTGDTIGASLEIIETVSLLVIAFLLFS